MFFFLHFQLGHDLNLKLSMKITGVFSKVFWSGGRPILRNKISPHLDCNAKIYSLHRRGLYLIRKRYLFPTPFWKRYFFPLSRHIIFWVPRGLFALILPYFAIILLFNFLFSHFLSPFFIFLPPFFLFFYIFPLFLFAFSYFSPQMTSGGIFTVPKDLTLIQLDREWIFPFSAAKTRNLWYFPFAPPSTEKYVGEC
jgi:hypothetical protein